MTLFGAFKRHIITFMKLLDAFMRLIIGFKSLLNATRCDLNGFASLFIAGQRQPDDVWPIILAIRRDFSKVQPLSHP